MRPHDVSSCNFAGEPGRRGIGSMEIFGIVLVALGVCLTLLRLPLPINLELGAFKGAWVVGPMFIVIGALIWWSF
jgi:hypothetical protein